MNQSQNPSSIRSRNEIQDALLKLMEIYPYQEISVKQIILETSLARRTFYRNFNSKDDVLDAIITEKIFEYSNE
ncbi:MAG: TetR/AcrR family transcriptional regulator, partial [Clostridiales bacterium]|nr:TetR/AcrR family transcriptional regulator [Clostridiales bacterium]